MESNLNVVDINSNVVGGGWTCSQCGVWVSNGTLHVCILQNTFPLQPSPNYKTFTTIGLCLGFANHDFVVSHSHAICNRCEKVVEFEFRFIKRLRKFLARAFISK